MHIKNIKGRKAIMKRLLAVILITLLAIGHVLANSYKLDKTKTAATPWKVGEIVYRYELGESDVPLTLRKEMLGKKIELKFLGVTHVNEYDYYIIQNFYADTKKPFTSAYLTREERSLMLPLNSQDDKNGLFIVWAPNGQKLLEGIMKGDMYTDIRREWHLNGQLRLETKGYLPEKSGNSTDFVCEWNSYGYLQRKVGNCPSAKLERSLKAGDIVYKYALDLDDIAYCCYSAKDSMLGMGVMRVFLGTTFDEEGNKSYRLQDLYIDTKRPFISEYSVSKKESLSKPDMHIDHIVSDKLVFWYPNGEKAREWDLKSEKMKPIDMTVRVRSGTGQLLEETNDELNFSCTWGQDGRLLKQKGDCPSLQ